MKVFKLSTQDHTVESIAHSATAIGFFDGVHKGHKRVIETMIQQANDKKLKKAVMTFDPHPSIVLNPNKQRTAYITPLEEKIEIFKSMNIDYVFIVQFSSELATLSHDEFVQSYIINNQIKSVVTGFDFTYGQFGKGNIHTLKSYHQFDMNAVDKIELNDEKVSTTKIIEHIKTNIKLANESLGRPYEMKGLVIQGDKRGRTIGFPTANIEPIYRYVLPEKGVYAVTLQIDGEDKIYYGVCNVGVKPTFSSKENLSIEVHIDHFDRTIYGEKVIVKWYEFIRPEQKFNGIEELKFQIEQDKARALEILKFTLEN